MIMSLKMGVSAFDQQSNHGIMGEEALDSISSSSEVSSESDLMEEVISSGSSLPTPPSSSELGTGALSDMSSLLQQLPFKRGLSKHFQGKSQSFTSLSNVRSLEDLAKPENPYNKKLKSCKSYGGLLSSNHSSSPRLISKKASRASCSSLITTAKRNSNRPPIHPPHRSNRTPLFA